MDFSAVKKITVPEGEVKRIECGGAVLWKDGYTNRIPLSIDTDGSIYNGGLGYKRGYRIRSGGAELATTFTSCSGFIPVSPGDVVRIGNCWFDYESNSNAINVSDASFMNIGQFTALDASYGIFQESAYSVYGYPSVVQEKEDVWKWVVPPASSGIAYIRLTCYDQVSGGPYEMILTINEEIE